MIAPLTSQIRLTPQDARPEWLDDPYREPRQTRDVTAQSLLGKQLVAQGTLTSQQLLIALALQARQNVPLGEILVAQGSVSEPDVLRILAKQNNTYLVNLASSPPDPALFHHVAAQDCLRLGFIPWRIRNGGIVFATAHPERINSIRVKLPLGMADAEFVLAAKHEIHDAIHRHYGVELAIQAEHRTADKDSCRNWSTGVMKLVMAACLTIIAVAAIYAPVGLIWGLFGAATFALVLNCILKIACTIIALRRPRQDIGDPDLSPRPKAARRLPKISILVPLFHERDIAGALVKRLARLSYPRELLEICLVVEASDSITEQALTKGGLPQWMRVVRVPKGAVQTKPRALNYALDFTSGSIVGVYDAEDAPNPGQLHEVARKFATGGADLACVQGVLSFYNARTNWLSRCFFFEYAGWFRVMLPGLQKLGFAIPLGEQHCSFAAISW